MQDDDGQINFSEPQPEWIKRLGPEQMLAYGQLRLRRHELNLEIGRIGQANKLDDQQLLGEGPPVAAAYRGTAQTLRRFAEIFAELGTIDEKVAELADSVG